VNCVECAVPQMARNHFFTGKLLVERDFTDEQRYLIGKDGGTISDSTGGKCLRPQSQASP